MKKFFLSAAAAFAAIPGLAIILKGTGTPPGYGYLFGGVIEAIGTLSLVILSLNRGKIRRVSVRRITRVAIVLIAAGCLSLILYLGLFKLCVISHPSHGTVYYPLWTSGRVAELVDRTGGRWQALDRYGITPIHNAISQMPPYAIPVTTAVLLFLCQAFFTCLTIAFGLVGFHEQTDL